jgi:DNA mismatch repair protein MSH6
VIPIFFLKAFDKLSKGMKSLADTAEDFTSKTVFGLLRSAPDLKPHIKNVQSMYEAPEKGEGFYFLWKLASHPTFEDADELVPVEGKDSVHDEIMLEINELEEKLEGELAKYEKKMKWVSIRGPLCRSLLTLFFRCKLVYWHSAGGTKVCRRDSQRSAPLINPGDRKYTWLWPKLPRQYLMIGWK